MLPMTRDTVPYTPPIPRQMNLYDLLMEVRGLRYVPLITHSLQRLQLLFELAEAYLTIGEIAGREDDLEHDIGLLAYLIHRRQILEQLFNPDFLDEEWTDSVTLDAWDPRHSQASSTTLDQKEWITKRSA